MYKIGESSKLIITDEVVDIMNKYKQSIGKNEQGGILLGKVKQDFSEFILTHISEPSKLDKSNPFSFVRSKKTAQIIINNKWQESSGEIMYLGEWHTHPEFHPFPSGPDRKLINDCLKLNVIYVNRLFMIILGNTGEFYVGTQTVSSCKMEELERIK